jgi:predicted nucleic acid-binding protein
LTNETAKAFVAEIERVSIFIENVPREYEYPRDPKDQPYINLAITADADYLTSRDKDLLELMNDRDFTARFPTTRVVDPVSLLREIESEPRTKPGLQP